MRKSSILWLVGQLILVSLLIASPAFAATISPDSRTVMTSKLFFDWSNVNANDPEEIDVIRWPNPTSGSNMTNSYIVTSTTGARGGEYFGNATAINAQGKEVALAAHNTGTWVQEGVGNEIIITSQSGGFSDSSGVSMVTKYTFFDSDPAANTVQLERTFELGSTPFLRVRPYIPRLHPVDKYQRVLYPATTGALANVDVRLCGGSCTVSSTSRSRTELPFWNDTLGWYAIHSLSDDSGIIIKRQASSVNVELWIDWDGTSLGGLGSYTNASSFSLTQPNGLQGTLTEKEVLCFYDGSSWPQAMRDQLILPPSCQPGNQAPTAKFTMSTADGKVNAKDGATMNFTVAQAFNSSVPLTFSAAQSSDPDGDRLIYEWLLDGTTIGTGSDLAHDLREGAHSITLKVMDDYGNQSTAQASINITSRSNTQALALSWPFIGITNWRDSGNGEGQGDHLGDDYYAQDWNWGGGQEDWGMVLLSPATGKVISISTCLPNCSTGYGQQVIIQNLDAAPYDYAIRFTHLEDVWVTDGQVLCPGTPVGLLGYSGLSLDLKNSIAAHLHVTTYLGIFQHSMKGSTGYHWLDTNGAIMETLSGGPSRFASRFQFDQTTQPQGCGDTFAIQGRVVVKNKNKAAGFGGVTVTLTSPQRTIASTTYDQGSGHYAFNGLAPGNYTITPVKTGCTFTPPSVSIVVGNSHVSLQDFVSSGPKCK